MRNGSAFCVTSPEGTVEVSAPGSTGCSPTTATRWATSSLGIPAERQIHEAMRSVLAGRTALVIAHRPSTIRIAGRVLVMSGGRVTDGSPGGEWCR